MIRLFDSIENDFTHNGIQVLDDVVYGDTCILTNEINGTYPLEMEVSIIDNDKWKDIDTEMFLRVPTSKGEQIFRIKEVVKGIDSIKVYGKHVFFDLENNFILDTNVVQKDGRGAINQILGAMSNNMINTYYGDSNISIVNNSRLVRKNIVSALIGSDDNSFINRWGGELEVDNFNFSIKQRIGEDRDFQIRYRKNLTGFEGNTNTYNLCTRIVPIGYDGIMLEGTKWVDSQYISNYPQIYTYEIKFDNVKVKKNEDDEEGYNTLEEARVALRKAAEDYFINSKCDLPTFSANVNFETLKYTEEYKDLNILERVELGDDVNIYIDKIDININARVVKTKYNFFTKKYTEIEIGDVKPNLFKQIANLKNTIDLVTEQLGGNSWQDILDKALDEATKLMQEGLKDSYVITMKNQIIIGDNPDINNMVNCIVFNKNGIGFSNNGYLPEQLVSAMTIDGKINASCITTGQLNAALIKTGLLKSFNGNSWLNMEDGTFDFANGNFAYDGNNLTMIGKIINVLNGFGIELDKGGLKLVSQGENVGGIRSARFAENEMINGVNIATLKNGDFIDFSNTESDEFGTAIFNPIIRLAMIENELMKNFKGIHLLDNILIPSGKKLCLESKDTDKNNWHELYNSISGALCCFGDNGIILGYKNGSERVTVLQIDETPNDYGTQVYLNKQLSLYGNKITSVSDIYTQATVGRYFHEGWCGSFEKICKRISNLNVLLSTGVYCFGEDANGSPSGINWGFLFCMKMNDQDSVQVLFTFANEIFIRSAANGTGHWSAWVQK